MKNIFITLLSLLLFSCSTTPHWQPIFDQYSNSIQQENMKYNGKIEEIFLKAEDELKTSNTYATNEEIKMLDIIQRHIYHAIQLARQDIHNYPLQNSFTKTYKRYELLKQRKITFSQAVKLSKYDQEQTEIAMNSAQQSIITQERARWDRMTQNIGKGLGKTERQVQMQENNVRTTCYKFAGEVICDSKSY